MDKTEYGELLERGEWQIEKISYEGETYRILQTLSSDEEGEYEVYYILTFEDDNTAQLILLSMFYNGEEIDLSDEDIDVDAALILYRQ